MYKDKVENNKDIIDFLMKIKNNKIKVYFNNDESIKKSNTFAFLYQRI